MNRLVAMMAILMLAFAHKSTAETNDIRMQQEVLLMRERLKQELFADIAPIVSHIKDGTISQKENRVLGSLLDNATRDDLYGKTVIERQQVVVKLLGKDDYEVVRAYYVNECQPASSRDAQQVAADILGHRLFSVESRNVLAPLLLSEDRETQFFAIISLGCLGEQGAYRLMHYMILSQSLADPEISCAIDALGVANAPHVGRLAVQLCLSTNYWPLAVSTCIPLMKKEPEYYQIVCDMLKSNRFTPPKREQQWTGDEVYRDRAVMSLLGAIDSNIDLLKKDDLLFKRIQGYAESYDIDELVSDRALLMLKRGGAGRKYFEGLLAKEGAPEHKQKRLRQILVLIDRDASAGLTANSDRDGPVVKGERESGRSGRTE